MPRKITDFLSSNWVSIILALLLALTVWIVASLEENPFQEADLPTPVEIDVKGLAPGLIITNDYPQAARVRVRAQQETWRSISAEDVLVTADLSGLGPGSHQVELIPQINTNAPAAVVSMNPRHVRFELEERDQREMPVQVQIEGQPAIGYSVGNKQITPSLVTVEGPESKVERISEVRARISVEAQRDDIQTTADLVPLDANGDIVTEVVLNPSQVTLDIPIKQEAGFRDISIIVRRLGNPPPGYYVSSIVVNPQIITVRGDAAVIEAMQPYAETEPIELSDKTDDFRQEVSIALPLGVTPVQNEKVEVLVTIGAQQGSRTVLDVPVQAQNLGDKLTATFSPNVVDIILSGPLTELDSLNPQQDITVTVDLNGLGPGRHQIEPNVEVIYEDIRVDSVLPLVIEVEIKTGTGK